MNVEITVRSASIGIGAIPAQVLNQYFRPKTFVRHSLLSLTTPKGCGFLRWIINSRSYLYSCTKATGLLFRYCDSRLSEDRTVSYGLDHASRAELLWQPLSLLSWLGLCRVGMKPASSARRGNSDAAGGRSRDAIIDPARRAAMAPRAMPTGTGQP
jgi:hypothetical protein